MTAPLRAALYLRVSTGRQADSDLSIPDQRRQAKGYCTSRGWEIVADYVEPGVSATDDRRPEFQRMVDAAMTKPPNFWRRALAILAGHVNKQQLAWLGAWICAKPLRPISAGSATRRACPKRTWPTRPT